MKHRYALPILSLALASAFLVVNVDSAEAGRKRCVYMAHHDADGRMIADGWAKAYKRSWACNRARRRCNRELERKRQRGEVPRGIHRRVACRKITNLSD